MLLTVFLATVFCGAITLLLISAVTFVQPKGFFTPPYETMESLRARLSTMYAEVDVTRYEDIACFRCRKVAL